MSSKRSIFRVTGPLCGESAGAIEDQARTCTRQPIPMMSERSVHLTPLPESVHATEAQTQTQTQTSFIQQKMIQVQYQVYITFMNIQLIISPWHIYDYKHVGRLPLRSYLTADMEATRWKRGHVWIIILYSYTYEVNIQSFYLETGFFFLIHLLMGDVAIILIFNLIVHNSRMDTRCEIALGQMSL